MQHYAAFHLGLHCLQKYSLRRFPNTIKVFHQDHAQIQEISPVGVQVHLSLVFKDLNLFYSSPMVYFFFKYFSRFQRGSNFFQGVGVKLLIPYKKHTCDFPGGGILTPAPPPPPPLDPRIMHQSFVSNAPPPTGMEGIVTLHFSEPWYKPGPVGTS